MIRAFWWVTLKELRETLRDNHTLIYSVGFPLLFYPMLIWAMFQLLLLQDGKLEREPPVIAVEGPALIEWMAEAEDAEIVAADPGSEAALRDGDLDLLAVLERDGDGMTVRLHHDSTRPRGRIALAIAREALEGRRAERLEALAAERGLAQGSLDLWPIEIESRSSPKEDQARLISMILPMFLVLVMLMAAVYPAVEVVVGERERRTLETTLSAAVPRRAVVAGKTAAVAGVVLIAVFGNAMALTLTLLHLGAQLDEGGEMPGLAVHGWQLLMASPLLLITTLLVSALTMVAVLPTRSFKAGQNAATFVVMGGLGLAMLGGLPLTELSYSTACLPLGNLVLVLQAALTGELTAGPLLLASVENLLLAGLALGLGGRLIQGEAFLFRGALPRWLRWMESDDD